MVTRPGGDGGRHPTASSKSPIPLPEIVTKRLVLVDDHHVERLVAEVVHDVVEVRIDLPGAQSGRRTGLLLFGHGHQSDLGYGLGVQAWAAGDLLAELSIWQDDEGNWQPRLRPKPGDQ